MGKFTKIQIGIGILPNQSNYLVPFLQTITPERIKIAPTK